MTLGRIGPAVFAVFLVSCVATPPPRSGACRLAVTNVSVAPMDSERILRRQTVRFGQDRILAVGRSSRVSSAGCGQVVDGSGKYLAPGLSDMHVHVETAAFSEAFGLPAQPIDFDTVFPLYVAHGVTSVRVMSGAPDILAFRAAGGKLPYPRLSVASPMLTGEPPIMPEPVTRIVRSAEEGAAAVREFKAAGYDFIKVRDNLSPDAFFGIVEEAKKLDLYVDGHLQRSRDLDAEAVLKAGQRGVAHVDNFVLEMNGEDADTKKFVAAMKACGCFVTSALVVAQNIATQIRDYDAQIARPEMQYVHPLLKYAFWLKPNNPYQNEGAPAEFFDEIFARGKRLLKAFVNAGVPVLAGSDALNPMIIPGASLHDELATMADAGLSPYEALAAATAAPAATVPGFAGTGRIAVGHVADAVLIGSNPLQDLSALRRPEAVILRGRLLTRAELDANLEHAAAAFEGR